MRGSVRVPIVEQALPGPGSVWKPGGDQCPVPFGLSCEPWPLIFGAKVGHPFLLSPWSPAECPHCAQSQCKLSSWAGRCQTC